MSRDEIEFQYALQGEGAYEALRRQRRATEAVLLQGRIKPAARRQRWVPRDGLERDESRRAGALTSLRRGRQA